MPPMLRDTYWGDADRFDVETLARQLAAAISAHMAGQGEDQVAAAAEEAPRAQGEPPHAGVAGDTNVEAIDQVAERLWNLLVQWERCRAGTPTVELRDKQRRLRWALDLPPDRVRAALPLVSHLAEADWNEYFRIVEPQEAEPDLRDELHSVRTQVAQGLRVARRWIIVQDFGEISAGSRDAAAYLWGIARGDETRRITVFISGTALASADGGLPQEVVAAKHTRGRSVVATLVALHDPPAQVMVTTAGISRSLPD